jgi:hypothetical protein
MVAYGGETAAPTMYNTCSVEEDPMDSRPSTGSEVVIEGGGAPREAGSMALIPC